MYVEFVKEEIFGKHCRAQVKKTNKQKTYFQCVLEIGA